MIECRGLQKNFGDHTVVSELDLRIEQGEFVVLIGASGSGKTTLLKMLNRLIEPSAGQVLIDGRSTKDFQPTDLRRQIGYGAQRAGLFPHLSVARNIGVTARLLGWSRERESERVGALLTRVGLPPGRFRDRDPRTLSGGEQQRVSLARALCAKPRLLLLDEPFGALDPVSRDALQLTLNEIAREEGLTVVFVTHDMSEALLLGDRVAFLERGRIAQLGPPSELLRAPASAGVADFLRAPQRQAAHFESLLRPAKGSAKGNEAGK